MHFRKENKQTFLFSHKENPQEKRETSFLCVLDLCGSSSRPTCVCACMCVRSFDRCHYRLCATSIGLHKFKAHHTISALTSKPKKGAALTSKRALNSGYHESMSARNKSSIHPFFSSLYKEACLPIHFFRILLNPSGQLKSRWINLSEIFCSQFPIMSRIRFLLRKTNIIIS